MGVSADGTHAAFESPAVLTNHENALHQSAVQGARNVYIYDTATPRTQVRSPRVSPDSAAGIGGSAPRSPGGLYAADGRYLLFVSPEPLTPDDTDDAQDRLPLRLSDRSS